MAYESISFETGGIMKIRVWLMTAICCFGLTRFTSALEIPLAGAAGAEGTGQKIGYVDMERIFQTYPQTKDAKEDFFKRRDKMREDLTAKERKLEEVKQQLAVLEATVLSFKKGSAGDTATQISSATADGVDLTNPDSVTKKKKELETLQSEYESSRKHAETDLIAF